MTSTDSRLDLLTAWLAGFAGRYALDLASLAPASSDASFRRYFRIAGRVPGAADGGGGTTLIVVDAPPPEKCREFVHVDGLLEAEGLHVPKVLETDYDAGFMLVTDLGTVQYIDVLDPAAPQAPTRAPGGASSADLMRAALDALILWQKATRPGELPAFDDAFMRREMELMPEWYIGRHLGKTLDASERAVLDRTFDVLIDSARAQPQVYMLRDFMPRNLMVAPPTPGVLDFQDAVIGPIAYDVVSLLRDAFISWEEDFQLDCYVYYWEHAKRAGLPVEPDFGEFYRQLEWMGLQRHIKVLGLFCRINYRDHKPLHITDLPRFLDYSLKVARRYRPLAPFARLLDKLAGQTHDVGYTF